MEGEGDDGATRGRFVSTRYSARRLARSRFAPSAVGAFSVRGDDDGEGGDAAARDAFLVFFSFFFLAALAAFLAAFLRPSRRTRRGRRFPTAAGDSAAAAGSHRARHRRETALVAQNRRRRVGIVFVLFLPIAATDEQTARRALRGGEGEGGIGRKSPPRGADARLPKTPTRRGRDSPFESRAALGSKHSRRSTRRSKWRFEGRANHV